MALQRATAADLAERPPSFSQPEFRPRVLFAPTWLMQLFAFKSPQRTSCRRSLDDPFWGSAGDWPIDRDEGASSAVGHAGNRLVAIGPFSDCRLPVNQIGNGPRPRPRRRRPLRREWESGDAGGNCVSLALRSYRRDRIVADTQHSPCYHLDLRCGR